MLAPSPRSQKYPYGGLKEQSIDNAYANGAQPAAGGDGGAIAMRGAGVARGTFKTSRERLCPPAACACERPVSACQNSFALDSFVDFVFFDEKR